MIKSNFVLWRCLIAGAIGAVAGFICSWSDRTPLEAALIMGIAIGFAVWFTDKLSARPD
jgi:hypothetical protein